MRNHQLGHDAATRRFTRRTLVLGATGLAGLGLLAGRLYQIQVLDRDRYAPRADRNRIATQLLAPRRGRILDRFGRLLADNGRDHRVVLVPALAGRLDATLERLARHLPLDAATITDVKARARRQPPALPVVVATGLTFEQIAAINLDAANLPGVETEPHGQRHYRHGRAMGHVLGHVGAVTRVALDDEPLLSLPGLRVGKSGVELGMDQTLRGSAGSLRREVDARGAIVRDLSRIEPRHGQDVTLTLDTSLQSRFTERLATERRAAAVALDARTGDVLALVSQPGFDVSELAGGVTTDRWRQLAAQPDDPLLNRAIGGQYPPGSTFKMVTALAGLSSGAMDVTTRLPCSGSFELGGHTFNCWRRQGHGPCDLHRALAESCDCYFYEVARRTGIEAIARMARELGLGRKGTGGIGLEKAGLIPTPAWKRGELGRSWLGGETVIAGIGQGYVLTTPLQLAVMTARLASGRQINARFVTGPGMDAPAAAPLDVDAGHLAAVRRAMTAVVHGASGTGRRADPGIAGLALAGKTGTSQVARLSALRRSAVTPWALRDHALFVGYFPANQPKYALATVIEHGGSGGAAAAPLMRDLVEEILRLDPRAQSGYPAAAPAHSAGTISGGG